MYRWILAACLLLSSCISLPSPCLERVRQASAISTYPVGREELIDQLSLRGVASIQRSDGFHRRFWYSEHWDLPMGCKLSAYDFEPTEEITRADIDRILNNPNPQTSSLEPRDSFDRIRIEDHRGTTVFDSTTVQ